MAAKPKIYRYVIAIEYQTDNFVTALISGTVMVFFLNINWNAVLLVFGVKKQKELLHFEIVIRHTRTVIRYETVIMYFMFSRTKMVSHMINVFFFFLLHWCYLVCEEKIIFSIVIRILFRMWVNTYFKLKRVALHRVESITSSELLTRTIFTHYSYWALKIR